MRKPHWEHLQKSKIKPYVDIVKKATRMTESIHEHPSDFAHIDCIYNHIQGGFPAEMKVGVSPLITPLRSVLFYSMFSGKIYKIAEEFSRELSQVNIQVRAECIPADNEVVCIELPVWSPYQACYLGTVEYPGSDSVGPIYRRIELQFCRPMTPAGDQWERVFLHFYNDDEIIEDSVDRLKERMGCDLPVSLDLLKFVINSYIYIHSGSPIS